MSNEVRNLVRAARGKILVEKLESGERVTSGGIVIRDDNMKEHGMRPRWAQVLMVGDGVHDLKPGDWVLIEHGRWTFGTNVMVDGVEKKIWSADPNSIMLAADEPPSDFYTKH